MAKKTRRKGSASVKTVATKKSGKTGASKAVAKKSPAKPVPDKGRSAKKNRKRTASVSSNTGRIQASAKVVKRVAKAVKGDSARRTANKSASNRRASRAANDAKAPVTALDPIQFPEDEKPIPKTYLSPKELIEFKELVLAKRRELAGDVNHLTDQVTNRKSQGDGQRSSMPIHMADIGSDNWEYEFTIGLIANERALLREIDEALDRIENGTYGICLGTHKKISKARLRAKPWAKYCIDYARARDEGRVR